MTTSNNNSGMAVWYCGDYSRFEAESEKAFKAGKNWMPKSAARKISSREINSALISPVSETMLDNSYGVFVVAPLWLGDAKGLEYVGAAKTL